MSSQDKQTASIFGPKTITELDAIIKKTKERLTYIAGGTDLMVQAEHWDAATTLVDLSSLLQISNTFEILNDGLLIGAAVPLSNICLYPLVQTQFPILIDACKQIGSVQIQNRATLGGNIANASPAGDSLPVLSVLDAELWIGPKISRSFKKQSIEQLIIGPGQTSLKNNEYIAYIFLPFLHPKNIFWHFRKVGQRTALAISKLSLAVIGWIEDGRITDIRISTGSVTAQVKRAVKTESLLKDQFLTEELIEQARHSIMSEVKPISDIRSTEEYRTRTCGELLRDALHQI